MNKTITIGQIINVHGVKGEIKVYPLTDDIKRFKELKTVLIEGTEHTVSWCKLQTNKVILKIEDINSIDEANKYRNKYLDIDRKDAVTLPKGRYFITDIIGCSVYDENSSYIGKVKDVIKTGSNDVYQVIGEKEVLVPAIKDVVKTIDVENLKIIIKPLDVWQ